MFDAIGSFLGGIVGAASEQKIADDNRDLQMDFATRGIQWKAADAKAAGLHPLAALGAQTLSYQPQQIDSSHYANMGQSLGRAVDSALTKSDRIKKEAADALALQKASRENDLLKAQTTFVQRSTNPPFPSGSITGDVLVNPDEITSTRIGDRATTASPPKPGTSEFEYRDGSVVSLPSPEAKAAIEDVLPYEVEHYARNRIIPWLARRYTDVYDMFTRKNARYRTNPYY